MKVLNLIFFASLVGSSWCGLILHNIRDELHSKLYGHGLHGENYQNSPIININNQQQVVQQSLSGGVQPIPTGPRGDYGSLPTGYDNHNYYGSNFKAGGTKYGHHGYNPESPLYGHHMGGDFRGESASGISSHQMMKQESYKHREGPKFGYHHDTNMFGNAQGVSGNNVPIYSSSSSSSSASSSSSSSVGGASSSSASSSSSSSSSGGSGGVFRPWKRRY